MKDDCNEIRGVSTAGQEPLDGPQAQLVMGFSSVGKSSFIKHLMQTDPSYQKARQSFARDFRASPNGFPQAGDLLHADLSTNYEFTRRPNSPPAVSRNPYLRQLIRSGHFGKAFVLVTSEDELRQRIGSRKTVGVDFGRDNSGSRYAAGRKLTMLNFFPLSSYYQIWLQELRAAGVPYQFVYAHNGDFTYLMDEAQALKLLSQHCLRRWPRRVLRRGRWGVKWWLSARFR